VEYIPARFCSLSTMGVEHGLLLEENPANFKCLTIMQALLITMVRSQESQRSKIL
jgi:hypothetical protein